MALALFLSLHHRGPNLGLIRKSVTRDVVMNFKI